MDETFGGIFLDKPTKTDSSSMKALNLCISKGNINDIMTFILFLVIWLTVSLKSEETG